MKWHELVRAVRITLNDTEPTDLQYTEEVINMAANWSLSELALHTAVATATGYTLQSGVKSIPIPSNVFEPIESNSLLEYGDNDQYYYLKYRRILRGSNRIESSQSYTFREQPSGYIQLDFEPTEGSLMTLYYFAYWDSFTTNLTYTGVPTTIQVPDGEGGFNPTLITVDRWLDSANQFFDPSNNSVDIPRWMEKPLVLLVSATLLNPTTTQTADLRRWNRKFDSGTPEDNPVMLWAESMIKQARQIMQQYDTQNRSTYWQNVRY